MIKISDAYGRHMNLGMRNTVTYVFGHVCFWGSRGRFVSKDMATTKSTVGQTASRPLRLAPMGRYLDGLGGELVSGTAGC